MLFVKTEDLCPGMRLAKPIYNRLGVLLYERNTELTPQGINSIRKFSLIGIYVLYALISGTAEHGWASLMLSIWFVGGVVLLSIGAVGLYIGKIYKEVKRRPLYNVEEVLYDDQNK